MVIGRSARNVAVEDALSYVAGYTVANDLSLRDVFYATTLACIHRSTSTGFPRSVGREVVRLDPGSRQQKTFGMFSHLESVFGATANCVRIRAQRK